jgi:C4-dicarboxylate transporter, DctQ subunit
MRNFLKQTEIKISKFENWALLVGILIMLVFGATQVLLRNIINSGIDGVDPLVRCMVLWIGFIGASLATRQGKHINMDMISKVITNKKLLTLRTFFINSISLILSSILLYASVHYTFQEAENNMEAFWGVPTWVIFIIVPISTCAMTVRIFISLILNKEIERSHSDDLFTAAS